MQNNLFTINNEERNRILNLHESRSKSQYLDSLKQDINTLSSKIDETYFLGVSPDEKIFFTNKNIYVNEGDELKKLEYDLDSLPYILETARKKCDKMLIEGNITLNKYLSVPQKFLMSLMEEWGVNNGVKQEINEHWNDKFKGSIKLLTENRQLIFENNLNHDLWDEVNLIANQVILEQAWNPFSKDFVVYKGAKAVGSAIGSAAKGAWEGAKKVGSTAWEGIKQVGNAVYQGGKWIVKGISKAAGKLLNWVLKKGIIHALRWIRRNLNSYIGMITEIIASMFPTVVVVKAIWCMIVILDIYEILYNDFDPKDPDRRNSPFMMMLTDLISLFTTGSVGAGSKIIFKTAAKEAVTKGAISSQAKGLLKTIMGSLPSLSGTLKYVQDILVKLFGQSVGGFLGKIFSGLDTIVKKLGDWIKKTFLNPIGATAKEIASSPKQALIKAGTGAVLGHTFATFMSENTLKKGDKGKNVDELQTGLIKLLTIFPSELKYKLTPTGIFDNPTVNAVKEVQKWANSQESKVQIPVDGVVKPDFAASLSQMTGVKIDLSLSKIGLFNTPFFKTLSGGFGAIMGTVNSWLQKSLGSVQGSLATK